MSKMLKLLAITQAALGICTLVGAGANPSLWVMTGLFCLFFAPLSIFASDQYRKKYVIAHSIATLALYGLYGIGGMANASTSAKSGGVSYQFMAFWSYLAFFLLTLVAVVMWLLFKALRAAPENDLPVTEADTMPVSASDFQMPTEATSLPTKIRLGYMAALVHAMIGIITFTGSGTYPAMWVSLAIAQLVFGGIGFYAIRSRNAALVMVYIMLVLMSMVLYIAGIADGCDKTTRGCRTWDHKYMAVLCFVGVILETLIGYATFRFWKALDLSPGLEDEPSADTAGGAVIAGTTYGSAAPQYSSISQPRAATSAAPVAAAAPVPEKPEMTMEQKRQAQQALATIQNMAADNDYYYIFGVAPTASMEDLAKRRRDLAQDSQPDADETQMSRINLIYTNVFKREDTRELYDRLCSYRKFYPALLSQSDESLQRAATNFSVLKKALKKANMPAELIVEMEALEAWLATHKNILPA
eukprot:TRINITY_DN20507_c0_g1_i1.p1 TRINITY_DN20507_c0_g1~~TRINITY_DN20507_c0_g1_i1.p1  ORF type:complete len:504 (+),score=115.74 TRINITY_DN20507_c0_g1_i1:97-1512(+)